ncbi:MAG TPA: YetF domain-containing protein [Burkholderiaceae bacterium]|nr:YetF domain-containing protein [Burkholderiaceae bacterium]
MDIFLRPLVIYLFLLVILRLAGKRTLSEMSTFDFVLVLIISEATQNALVGDDHSLTRGMMVILILVALDRLAGLIKSRSERLERVIEGVPLVLVDHGKVREECLRESNVSVDDILQAARQTQGIARLEQIRYAVLESSGGISVIPMDDEPKDLERRIEAAVARALKSAASSDATACPAGSDER